MAAPRRLLAGLGGRLVLLALSTALGLLAAELLVRWTAPQQLIRLRPDVWIPDHEGLGWRMAPHLDTWVNTGERDVHLWTDGYGHRIGGHSATPAGRRILALGDSFLAAIEVAFEDTAAARLEESLSAAATEPVRIVNTGVAGWGPNHYLEKCREELGRERYDLVLVFLFRGNDVVDQRREVIPPKQGEVVHRFRWLRGVEAGEIRKAWLYPINDSLERRSHLFVLVRRATWSLLMRMGLSGRRFPQAELRSEAGSPRWRITGELCAEIDATARRHGVRTLFVLLPGAYHVEPELGLAYASAVGLEPSEVDLEQSSRLLGAELARRRIDFVDLTAALRELRASGTRTHGQVDTHLSPDGHAAVARRLHGRVLKLLSRGSDP